MTVKVKTQTLTFVELPALRGYNHYSDGKTVFPSHPANFGIARVGRKLYVNTAEAMLDGYPYFALPTRLASRLLTAVRAMKIGEEIKFGGAIPDGRTVRTASLTVKRVDRYHIVFTPPCGEEHKIKISQFTRAITLATELPASTAEGVTPWAITLATELPASTAEGVTPSA